MIDMMNLKGSAITFVLFFLLVNISFAQEGRTEIELSGEGWSLWLDLAADWYNDDVYLPPVNINELPVNPPTVGWEALHNNSVDNRMVDVPGTVEEYYWGEIGGAEISNGPRTGGDFVGVSWWSRTFDLDPELIGKRILLHFEQVNLRAEVFINGELVGYDVIGNTQFEVDATEAVVSGENRLDVRITDPVGNFTWNDNILMRWGDNYIPAVHGFGGITGKILLQAIDDVRIKDIYVQNQPDPKKIKVFTTVESIASDVHRGELTVELHKYGNPDEIVWSESIPAMITPDSEGKVFEVHAHVPDADLWQLSGYGGESADETALYEAKATFTSETSNDSDSQRFGFRWFDVDEKDGDKMFYLNGERVFIMAAMTRGFWPTNGIFATPEMAQRDMQAMFDLGMNTMLMHRAIGQPPVFEYADKNGLFTYQEPSGYRIMPNREDNIEGPDQQARDLRREKLRRMVIRDRSFPSSIIYNLKNEATLPPDYDDIINIQFVHDLDPSRIVTYNSDRNRSVPYDHFEEIDPYKMHILPFEDSLRWSGWWDHHYWIAHSGYVDEVYNNPKYYLRDGPGAPRIPQPKDSLLYHDPSELIFHGEEGAFGTIVRLEKIKEYLDENGALGFREQEHIDWFQYYNKWLDESDFRESYESVDELTTSLGRNLHYYHGRNIENIRMGNVADAYVMNGWGSGGTRTDIVDMYRYPTADPSIISHYTQPLYVAVKLRNKVLPFGATPIVDFWIINEENLNGDFDLKINYTDPSGNTIFEDEVEVKIKGGEEFGELLVENMKLPEINATGHFNVNARIVNSEGVEQASGFDEAFSVNLNSNSRINSSISVLENDNSVSDFLQDIRKINISEYSPDSGETDVIIVGNHITEEMDQSVYEDLIRRALEGTKLIVLENAHKFADEIDNQMRMRPVLHEGEEIVNYGAGGRFFVNQDPVLTGLPQGEGMSWEYQTFYKPNALVGLNRRVEGLRLHLWNHEPIVALGSQGSKEIITSLGRVRTGQGLVILSTLNILPNLQTEDVSAVVAQKLFLNLLEN